MAFDELVKTAPATASWLLATLGATVTWLVSARVRTLEADIKEAKSNNEKLSLQLAELRGAMREARASDLSTAKITAQLSDMHKAIVATINKGE